MSHRTLTTKTCFRMVAIGAFLSAAWSVWAAAPVRGHDGGADQIWTGSPYNGNKIYLSPAKHNNPGCGSYLEGENMRKVAHHSAHKGNLGNFQQRGYKVRVGHAGYQNNSARSNNWGSKRHIPLHSNAAGSSQCSGGGGGTITFYKPGCGLCEDLARKLKNKIGEDSAGSAYEYVASNGSLYELNNANMKAAYVEANFHTWNPGKNWLVDYESWSWRIGYGVDVHLGYP